MSLRLYEMELKETSQQRAKKEAICVKNDRKHILTIQSHVILVGKKGANRAV